MLRIFIGIITMTFNVVSQEGILWLSVGEISMIIGRRRTALAHTLWRQVLLAISTMNCLILGHFLEHGARWPILMHAGERDNFTDSKYIPLQRFDAQVCHCASLSGRFVLQQVAIISLLSLERVLIAKFSSPACGVTDG